MHVISRYCIKCDICAKGCPINPNCDGDKCRIYCSGSVCPVGAIAEGETQYIITDKCNDCGRCVRVCPVGAISFKPEQGDRMSLPGNK